MAIYEFSILLLDITLGMSNIGGKNLCALFWKRSQAAICQPEEFERHCASGAGTCSPNKPVARLLGRTRNADGSQEQSVFTAK